MALAFINGMSVGSNHSTLMQKNHLPFTILFVHPFTLTSPLMIPLSSPATAQNPECVYRYLSRVCCHTATQRM